MPNEDDSRKKTIMECWERVNALIKKGPMEGNGLDPMAQRNGLILATNILMDMIEE